MKSPVYIILISLGVLIFYSCKSDSFELLGEEGAPLERQRHRTIVTTDGEVDDVDSFIRFLFYTNEFDVEGLVYSSSQWHYKGDGQGTKFTSEMPNTAERYGERTELRWPGTTWMQDLIGKYKEIHPNLQLHAEGFPEPEALLELVKIGNIDFEGEMEKDTEGSDWIKSVLLDKDPRPVYIQIWGGTNTAARALKSIEEEYKGKDNWEEIYTKVSDKAVLYTVLDQDATYEKYIEPNWPEVKVIYNSDQFWCFAYPWVTRVPEELRQYLSGDFFKEHILFERGPLAGAYYTWGDGRQIDNDDEHDHGDLEVMKKSKRQQYDFISEGDSPAFFYLLDVGLRSMENPAYGGWGGRFVQSQSNPNRWEDGKHVTDFNPYTKQDDATYPQTRWVKELQHDFAARAAWSVKSYKETNHAPEVSLKHDKDLKAKVGDKVVLQGQASDPDGDELEYLWWHYMEAGSMQGVVQIQDRESKEASFVVPEEARLGDTIHMIFEVRDNGYPSLTRYQRVIVHVEE